MRAGRTSLRSRAALVALLPLACSGLNDAASVDALPPPPGESCKSFSQLAPAFFRAIDDGELDGLRRVIATSLSQPPPGDPNGLPPIASLLHGVVRVLGQ